MSWSHRRTETIVVISRSPMDTRDWRLGAGSVHKKALTGCHAEKLLSATIPLGSIQSSPVQSGLCEVCFWQRLCPGIIIHGYLVVMRQRMRKRMRSCRL